jgi:type I restriction enzyme M protein
LGSPGLGYVRDWILTNARVLASIDLHPDAFMPRNATQTSVLVLQRKRFDEIELESAAGKKRDYDVFMALANHIGHDKRGNKTYVRDAEGNEVVETRTERQQEVHAGSAVYKTVEVRQKIEDDNTIEIARTFRQWLAEQE